MDSDSTTQAKSRTDLLLEFIGDNHPGCPGCGHQLSSGISCPECGITPHLSLNPRDRFSLPWLFIFIPWLSLVGSGILNWMLLLAVLIQGGMAFFFDTLQLIPPMHVPFVLSLELMLTGSPFMVIMLWRKRERIRQWKHSTIFLLGILPVLGWCYSLLTAAQVING